VIVLSCAIPQGIISQRPDPFLLVSTIRNNLIRVISARDMSKKEREVYQNE